MQFELVYKQIIQENNQVIVSYDFKTKPHIAIVTNVAKNLFNLRYELAIAIKNAGYEPILIAAPDAYVKKIEEAGWKFVPVRYLEQAGNNLLKDILLFKEFIDIYKLNNICFCLHYNKKPLVYAGLAASLLNIPYISTITDFTEPFSQNLHSINPVINLLYKISLKKSHTVLFRNKQDFFFSLDKNILNKKTKEIAEDYKLNNRKKSFNEVPGKCMGEKIAEAEINSFYIKLIKEKLPANIGQD